jgi:mutator family transposase
MPNPLERVNLEIARRSDVVGIYPNDAALLRLATSLLVEQNDEWLVQKRYLSLESLQPLVATHADVAGSDPSPSPRHPKDTTLPETGPCGPADDDQPALSKGALAAVGKSTT